MIYIMLLWVVISTIAISVCYSDAKKYHYTMKFFLSECFFCTILTPFTAMFLVNRLIELIKIKLPKFKINTSRITKFLNKKL
jgi:ACR3 family arsenite efflux pump ArsB